MISESDSPLKGDWEAGIGKIWSSPTIGPDGAIYIGVTNTVDPTKSVLVALEDEGITGAATSAWPMKGRTDVTPEPIGREWRESRWRRRRTVAYDGEFESRF